MPIATAEVPRSARPFLITFSGIDGAGKTTQIERVTSHLQARGLRVLCLSFWEHVATWSNMRAEIGPRIVHSSDPLACVTFSPRNNKHVRKWYLTAARSAFYVLDVARLHRVLASGHTHDYDVVIFDRYIYDQIANLDSQSMALRAYRKFLLKQAPAPDLAFVIDALPAEAFARKPEYPLEFVYRNRRSFLRLRELHAPIIVIPAASVEEMERDIRVHINHSRLGVPELHRETTDLAADQPLLHAQTFPTAQQKPTAHL